MIELCSNRKISNDLSSIFEFLGNFNMYRVQPNSVIEYLDNRIEIEIPIPGYTKDEVKVSMKENILTVKGEIDEEETKKAYKKSFVNQYEIPNTIDFENISAKRIDGILTILLPYKEQKKREEKTESKEIKIN